MKMKKCKPRGWQKGWSRPWVNDVAERSRGFLIEVLFYVALVVVVLTLVLL